MFCLIYDNLLPKEALSNITCGGMSSNIDDVVILNILKDFLW